MKGRIQDCEAVNNAKQTLLETYLNVKGIYNLDGLIDIKNTTKDLIKTVGISSEARM